MAHSSYYRAECVERVADERDVRHFQHNNSKTQSCNEPIDTILRSENFLLETESVHVNNIESDDLRDSRCHRDSLPPCDAEPPLKNNAADPDGIDCRERLGGLRRAAEID